MEEDILNKLIRSSDDVMRYEIIKNLKDEDVLSLAKVIKATDTFWYKILKDRCGGLYKEYRDIEEFNKYNHTNYNTYREALIGGYELDTDYKIRHHMIDLMWLNLNRIYDDLLVYISGMPQYTLNKLIKMNKLTVEQIGSILTKQGNYDEAYEYFKKGSSKLSDSNYEVFFDLAYIVEIKMDKHIKNKYLNRIRDYYRVWSDEATLDDKLKYGRFYAIGDNEFGNITSSGIIKSIVREDDLDDIYRFIERNADRINLDLSDFVKILSYTDNVELLSRLLEYVNIDDYIVRCCMCDERLLNIVYDRVGNYIYVEDIVDENLLDVSKLIDVGFKVKGSKIIVRGYQLYPPVEYDINDFDEIADYLEYKIYRDKNFVLQLYKYVDDITMSDFMWLILHIVQMYRFDNQLIHELVERLNESNAYYYSQYLMYSTRYRSEIIDDKLLLNIYVDELRNLINDNLLKSITQSVNIKYLKDVNFNDIYEDDIIEKLLECENESIYKPMELLDVLLQNKSIRTMLNKVDIENSRSLYELKKTACIKNRTYPLQYIGQILGVDFLTLEVNDDY